MVGGTTTRTRARSHLRGLYWLEWFGGFGQNLRVLREAMLGTTLSMARWGEGRVQYEVNNRTFGAVLNVAR